MKRKSVFVLGLFVVAVLVQAAPANAASGGQRIVARFDGSAQVFALNAAASSTTCGSGVAFVLDVTPNSNSNIVLNGSGQKVDFKATVSCSAVESGNASLSIGAVSNGAGYTVTPANISVSLTNGASDTKQVTIAVTNPSAITNITAVVLSVLGGTFDAAMSGTIFHGVIPAGSPLVTVQILPQNSQGSGGTNPSEVSIATAVFQACDPVSGASSSPTCKAVNGSSGADVAKVLNQVSPEKATAVPSVGKQIIGAQMGNIAQRMAVLINGGGTGFSSSGLNLMSGSGSFSLGEIGDLVSALNAASNDNENKRDLLGGTRWGFWINGTIGGGSHDLQFGNSAYDFDTRAVTGGVDYRFNDKSFAGVGLGLSHVKSDFSQGEGDVKADTVALHGYGGYLLTPELSLDASLSYLHGSYDLNRNVTALAKPQSAQSSLDSNQLSASVGLTWNLRSGNWTFAPQAQYQYIRTHVGAFSEHGNADLRWTFGSQRVNTSSVSAGGYVDYTAATSKGTFRPYARVLFFHDGGTGAYNILASLPGQAPIDLYVAKADRSYGTAEVGLGFSHPIGSRTVDFNFGVSELFGYDALSRWAVHADMRVPF
jgi:uncharacterized protein YhjY with autotransporter beta-barrel domain